MGVWDCGGSSGVLWGGVVEVPRCRSVSTAAAADNTPMVELMQLFSIVFSVVHNGRALEFARVQCCQHDMGLQSWGVHVL